MTMPAGRYWVGDLCYTMHSEWEEVCNLIITGNTCLDGEFNLKDGRRFAIYSTAYGDGEYPTNYGKFLSVDSGSIGCIKVEDIDTDNKDNFLDHGMIVEFDEEFESSGGRGRYSDWDGEIVFGDVKVYTGEEEYTDEEYNEDDYDEDES